MSDYTLTVKETCCCGADIEVNSKSGNGTFVTQQLEEFRTHHKECPKLKFPTVKIVNQK
jgi:hypothetical protein